MVQVTTSPSTRSQYSERILGRIVPVFAVVIVIINLFALRGVIASARNELSTAHTVGIDRVNAAIEEALSNLGQELAAFGRDIVLTGTPDEDALMYLNALENATELIEQNPDKFVAIRFVTPAGIRQLEVINRNGEVIATESAALSSFPFEPIISKPAFGSALSAAAGTLVVSDFYLQPGSANNPEAPPVVLVDLYLPVASDVLGELAGVLQLQVDARELLSIIRLADRTLIDPAADRRVILLEQQGPQSALQSFIIADSGAENDSYLRALGNDEGNMGDEAVYDNVVAFNESLSEDVLTRFHAGNIISTKAVELEGFINLNWRVLVVDNALSTFAPTIIAMIGILGVMLLLTFAGIYVMRRLITPLLQPIEVAENMVQGLIRDTDSLRQPSTAAAPTMRNEFVEAVQKIGQRLEELNQARTEQVSRYTRDLQVAGHIGREAATQNDLDTLAHRTINLICNELGFYHAQIFLLDDVGANAVLRYSRGEAGNQLIAQGHSLRVGSDTIIGTVTKEKRPSIVNNTQVAGKDPHAFNPLLPETRAEMALPLVIGEKLIGALDIQSRRPNSFSEVDLPTYQLLADQLAIAINNALLRSEAEQRVEEIRRLNRQLTREAWQSVDEKVGLSGQYGSDTVKGDLSTPISIRGEVIGILEADLPDGQAFSDGDRMILQAVAERVALAVENARLFQETQVSLNETSTLYQLSRQLNEANTLEDVLQAIIVTVAPDASGGQVWLFEEHLPGEAPDDIRISVDLQIIPREYEIDLTGTQVKLSQHEFLQDLNNANILIIDDLQAAPDLDRVLAKIFKDILAQSMVFIPLNMRGIWKGFMTVEFDRPRRFSEGERRVYNALIAQAGVAIDNRLLLQQTENALSRQEKLYAASRIINTTQKLSDLVYAAVATSSDPSLDFWLALLEGDLDEHGWPSHARLIAKSANGTVEETDELQPLFVTAQSPMRQREPEVFITPQKVRKNAAPVIKWMHKLGLRFVAMFPLFSDNSPLALFYIVNQQPNELSTDDYEVYKALTGQMSTQIQNRRLLIRTEEALNETRRLYVAARAISGAQDLSAIYEAVAGHLAMPIIQQSADQPGNVSMSLLLAKPYPAIDAPRLQYAYQWLSNPNNIAMTAVGTMMDHQQAPIGYLIAENDDMLLVYHDIEQDAPNRGQLHHVLTEGHATGAAIASLWSRQRWFGALIIRVDNPDVLDESYERFMQAIADQIAIAIENQSLLSETEFERERLNTILSTLPTGVLVLDPQTFKPRQHNERTEELLGRALDYNKPFTATAYNMYRTGTNLLYPNEDLPIYRAQRENQQVLGDDIAIIHEITQTDLLISAAPIFDADGTQRAIVTAFQDISTLRSMENTMQENLRETVLLYETQRAMGESDTLDALVDNVVMQLAMQQPADAYVILYDAANDRIILERSLIQPLENVEALRPLLLSEPLNINDVQRSTHLDEDAQGTLAAVGARSVLILPLRAKRRAKPLGWLVLVDAAPEAFTSDQERTLSSVADMASAAVDNLFLIESTQDALQETAALYNATTTISRSRDLQELFVALEVAVQTLKPDMYAGYLLQDDLPVTIFKQGFEAGAHDLDFNHLLRMELPSKNENCFISNMEAADENDNPLKAELARYENIRAFAVVNLRVKDVTGGRLFLGYNKPVNFTENDTRFMNAVSDSASVVIDNQLLLEQIQNTLQETSVLYQASKALLETSSPQEIIEVIVNYLIEPHINQVFVAMLNETSWHAGGAAVEVVATWQSESDVDLLGVTLSPEQFPAWTQLSSPSVLTINDIYDENYDLDMLEQTSIESLDTRSLVILPLRVPTRAIGAIWLGSKKTFTYTDRDLRIFQAFAEQTSLTLEAARLLEQTDARARQLETSAVIGQSVGQILDLDVLLPQVVDLIQAQFAYDHVQVFMMDEETNFAMLVASTGEAGEKLLNVRHKLERGSASVIGQVTELGVPSIALDTADANVVHQPNPYLPLTRSEMALPLLVKGEVVGALDVQSNQPNAFTDEDIQVLTVLAAQIAVAIDNARLYEEAESRASDMSFLFEITTAAAAAESIESAMQVVADNVRSSEQALATMIYLPQEYEDYHGNRKVLMEMTAYSGDIDLEIDDTLSYEAGDAENMLGMVSATLQAEIINNIDQEVRYNPVHPAAQSAILVPITSGANVIGVIVMESYRVNAFNHDHRNLLFALAGSLSAIIQNTILVEQLQETNEQLLEIDRLKSQFLASMSHELRTPLNSIIGFSRVMLKGISGQLTEMQEQDLTTIYNSGNHLLNLINDILDQAKIEADELNLKFTYFDIKPMIESVKSIAIGLLKEKPLNLDVEIASNLPKAYGDEFRSRQILLNLVTNAIKFTVEGGVTIRAYSIEVHEGTMIRIDVIDTGIGIAEKDMPVLFEQFRQIDSSLTRTVGGTGLGLPISKSLAEMQGGELVVESQVNVGSTFTVLIPTYEGAEEELVRQREARRQEKLAKIQPQGFNTHSGNGTNNVTDLPKTPKDPTKAPMTKGAQEDDADTGRFTLSAEIKDEKDKDSRITQSIPIMNAKRDVLLIEDNKEMVDHFRRILQHEGFEVRTADHPSYAEAMVGQIRPALVVLDVNFAEGSGWELLENLKERDDSFDIPIVVTTMSEDSERAYRLGAHTFIARPFLPETFLEAVLEAEKESQRERILIIDDQPEAIRLLTQLLAQHGDFRVFSAQSGDEGISLVARRRPDLIILDLRMPGKDGFAVLDELRGNPETAKIPVLVVTGDIDLSTTEMEQLQNIRILPKTDISQEDYEQFIENVRSYLENTNEDNKG